MVMLYTCELYMEQIELYLIQVNSKISQLETENKNLREIINSTPETLKDIAEKYCDIIRDMD